MKQPIRVAVTGSAGQIAYSLLFRIASGEMFGQDQPVILHLLEVTPALTALKVVVMELEDCAFPLLHDIVITDDEMIAFTDIDYALLVGAMPRQANMERSDLLKINATIFAKQGQALNDFANRNVKVLIVGNPANTNAYIAAHAAPDLNAKNFAAMTRLDHNRAISQLAIKTGFKVSDIKNMIIWGNHSTTQYPDIHHATIAGMPANDLVDEQWVINEFMPIVQNRGAEIIQARGKSSAASAASAAIEHMQDWVNGTQDWTSMAVPSDGSYGIPEGLFFSYPVTVTNGEYHIVQDLEMSAFSQNRLDITCKELEQEKEMAEILK